MNEQETREHYQMMIETFDKSLEEAHEQFLLDTARYKIFVEDTEYRKSRYKEELDKLGTTNSTAL